MGETKECNCSRTFYIMIIFSMICLFAGGHFAWHNGYKAGYTKAYLHGQDIGFKEGEKMMEKQAVDGGFAEYIVWSQKCPNIVFSWKYKLLKANKID